MAKVALVTDTHIGCRGDSQVFAKYFTKFFSEVFFPYIDQHDIKHIIHLGDVVDKRKTINFLSSNQLHTDLMKPIHDRGMEFWCIIGNHDIFFRNSLSINAIQELYGTSTYNINLIDTPTDISIDGCNILLMPWICSENSEACMQSLNGSQSQILMGHLEINGFEMHRGAVCETGKDPNIFEKFDSVFSGHFHHKSSNGNITYLGSPYEMTWNDYGDSKGFHIFDTETRELTFVPNPHLMFYRLKYDDTVMKIEELDDIDFSIFENTYMKLIVKNKTNPYMFDLFVEKIEKSGIQHLQILEEAIMLDGQDESSIISEAMSTVEIFETFIENIDTDLDKTRLNNILGDLYKRAMDLEIY
jgi:DNA repair exonuclease SbcCD nuclease subunit